MKGRRLTRRKKKRPARGTKRRWGGIFSIFKSKQPAPAAAPVAAPVAASVAPPINNSHSTQSAAPVAAPVAVPAAPASNNKKVGLFNSVASTLKQTLTSYSKQLANYSKKGNIGKVTKLLDKGIHPNTKYKVSSSYYPELMQDATPLHWAAINKHTELVKLLLDRGADINARDVYGFSAMHWAARNGNTELVKLLIDNGADFDLWANGEQLLDTAVFDSDKRPGMETSISPLVLAVLNGHLDTIKLLLEKGADPGVDYYERHRNPIDYAEYAPELNRDEITNILEEKIKQEKEKRAQQKRNKAQQKRNKAQQKILRIPTIPTTNIPQTNI